MLVTIFESPSKSIYRVREMGETGEVSTVKWCRSYSAAEQFVKEHYSSQEFVDNENFRAIYALRNAHPEVRNG